MFGGTTFLVQNLHLVVQILLDVVQKLLDVVQKFLLVLEEHLQPLPQRLLAHKSLTFIPVKISNLHSALTYKPYYRSS